jgi:ATP-dependent RNA circularization protein (DNA/RNA ligase family)
VDVAELQRRQRAKAKRIVEDLEKHRRPGEAEIVFVFDTGEMGSISYVSTADREDCMTALIEWLFHQDRDMMEKAISRYVFQVKLGPEVAN